MCPQVGLEVAHPGVANDFGDVEARKYYTYYQWVCFVLFFQVSGFIGDLSHVRCTCMRDARSEQEEDYSSLSFLLFPLPGFFVCPSVCLSTNRAFIFYIYADSSRKDLHTCELACGPNLLGLRTFLYGV